MWKPLRLATVVGHLTPSFLSTAHAKRPSQPGLTSTSYIDGLRGYAAVIVVIFHTSLIYSSNIVFFSYGFEGNNRTLLQLPIVRLLFSGHSMVSMFFVLGGYVNALKPLSLIRSGNLADLAPALSSSLLRRVVRLCIPPLVSTLAIAITLYLGLWEPARHNLPLLRFTDGFPSRQDTLAAELYNWYCEMVKLFNLAAEPYFSDYDNHLWTVPTELRAGLVLAVVLLMVARCTTRGRLVLLTLLAAYMVGCGRWEIALYIAGAGLAELDMVRPQSSSSSPVLATLPCAAGKPNTGLSLQERKSRYIRLALLTLASLLLLSCPSEALDRTPGYRHLLKVVPASLSAVPFRFIHGVGAILAVNTLSQSKTLQKPFTLSLSQYLGSISFSLYIMHGPVLHIISYALVPALWRIIGQGTDFRYNLAVFAGNGLAYLILLWIADLFYTHVDMSAVKLSRQFEQAVTT